MPGPNNESHITSFFRILSARRYNEFSVITSFLSNIDLFIFKKLNLIQSDALEILCYFEIVLLKLKILSSKCHNSSYRPPNLKRGTVLESPGSVPIIMFSYSFVIHRQNALREKYIAQTCIFRLERNNEFLVDFDTSI